MTTPAERRAAAAEGPRLGDLTALLVRHSRQLLLGAGVNVAAALALAVWIRGAATELPFAATLRQLRGELPSGPEASHADPA